MTHGSGFSVSLAALVLSAACSFMSEPKAFPRVTLLVTNPNCTSAGCKATPVTAIPLAYAMVTPGGVFPQLAIDSVKGPSACIVFPASGTWNGVTTSWKVHEQFQLQWYAEIGRTLVHEAPVSFEPGLSPGWAVGGSIAQITVTPAPPCG